MDGKCDRISDRNNDSGRIEKGCGEKIKRRKETQYKRKSLENIEIRIQKVINYIKLEKSNREKMLQ